MRVSTQAGDPGYSSLASHCRVFLNGAECKSVLTADEEKRYALLAKLDDRGEPVMRAGRLQTIEFFGAVRIEVPTWWGGATDDCVEC